jgi:hypothetical protein
MSSGSSGRYQSRLFNFVHQQSRRLTSQWDHTVRHMQVATKWGVEVLLYPLYLLLHSAASNGKILGTQEPVSRPQLQPNDTDFPGETPPPADTPIQQVLEAVQSLPSELDTTNTQISAPLKFLSSLWAKLVPHPTTKSNSSPSLTTVNNESANLKCHLPLVRGIATNLVNRNLVLVSTDNEILDILTPQQQAKLEARIINEIGNYWHSWQLATNKQAAELLPEIQRILAKLTGKTTTKIPQLSEGIPKDLLPTDKLLAFLDASIAKLETNAVFPAQQRSQELVRIAQLQLDIFLYGKEQVAARGDMAVTAEGLETHILNFQALIEAALNYFFGVNKGKNFEPKYSNNSSPGKRLSAKNRFQVLPATSQSQHEVLAVDPWLNWSDLFGKVDTVTERPITSKPNPVTVSSSTQQLNSSQPKTKFSLLPKKKVNHNLTTNQRTSGKLNKARTSQAITKSHQNTQIETQPDWIDVEATFIGYDKHPLEQLLEWLDHAILWLEEIVAKIFQVLQSLWRGR